MTYTYATMEVSMAAYEEIKKKLLDAGYSHALHEDREDGVLLDMHGIALKLEPAPTPTSHADAEKRKQLRGGKPL